MVDTWNAAQLNEAANNGSIGGGGSSLPSVTVSDNGKVLGVVEGAWAKMDAPSGNNYSTTAQVIGKWTDGTTNVYRKTYTGTVDSSGTTVLGDMTGLKVVGANAFFYSSEGNGLSLGVIPGVQEWNAALHINSSHELAIMSASALSGGSYTVTIDYIEVS